MKCLLSTGFGRKPTKAPAGHICHPNTQTNHAHFLTSNMSIATFKIWYFIHKILWIDIQKYTFVSANTCRALLKRTYNPNVFSWVPSLLQWSPCTQPWRGLAQQYCGVRPVYGPVCFALTSCISLQFIRTKINRQMGDVCP